MADRTRNRLLSWKIPSLQQVRKKIRVRPQSVVTVLDVDSDLLRVVQVAPRGTRTAVTRIFAEKLELPVEADRSDPLLLGKEIARILGRLRIKPGAVIMGVPRALVVLRTLSLPVMEDLKELASMVHFQIGKDLPFRLEDAVIDFTIRRQFSPPTPVGGDDSVVKSEPAEMSPKLEVLVAAVKASVVDFYRETAAAAGFKLAALGWLSYANARAVEACRAAQGNEGVALVSLRPDEVGIDVIAQQSLLFSRGATLKLFPEPTPGAVSPAAAGTGAAETPLSAVEPTAATGPETVAEAVTIEVVRSLHSYGGMDPHIPVAKLMVTGATGQESAVVQALKERLNIPCSLLEPVTALDLPRSAREHAAGSISALGLGFGFVDPRGLSFDFLNPKRPAVQRNLRRIRMMAGAAAAAAVLLLLLSVRSYLTRQRTLQYERVKQELAEAEKKRPLYRQMRQQAATLRDWAKEGRNWLEHYAYLTAVLPASEEVYITSLSISGQGSIRLGVQARSGEILAKLDKQLRAAGYDVKPLAITPGSDRFGYNFRSLVELTAPEEMKIDLAKVHAPLRLADDASLESLKLKGGAP
jgi:type IV pilus assembly protein PilM